MTRYYDQSVKLHRQLRGKIEVHSKVAVETLDDLSVAYTPGVAAPCERIKEDPESARELTIKGNSVAVVTDGSAVLGLGNIGPMAALPVMEGKALLFKKYGGIDAWPICLDTQDSEEIIATVKRIAPGFGAVNLEDIGAPRCFEIEKALQDIGIPVFHDDQHGTAIVLMAALMNAAKVVGKKMGDLNVVISGAGAAGMAIASLLKGIDYEQTSLEPVNEVIACDSKGAIYEGREGVKGVKAELASFTNREKKQGSLKEVLAGADVFIGVSLGGLLVAEDVAKMNEGAILFAMANPEPEIMPEEAKKGGAVVVGTGRSDFANQVNNVLAFPGIFRGALDAKATRITAAMKWAAVESLVAEVKEPTVDFVIPNPLDPEVGFRMGKKVAEAWVESE